jgi:drug/metabolite transporter (DMT)-like permease
MASTPPTRSAFAQGRWMVLAAAVMWGATATLARFMFRDHHVPALTVVELRLLIACSLLLPWMLWRKRPALRMQRSELGYLLVLGIFGVAAVQGTYYYSISKLGVGLSILLQYLAPALIVLYEMLRGRRPSARTLSAVIAAILCTALLVGGVDRAALRASALEWTIGFASAFAFTFYILFSKRGLARHDPSAVLLYTFAIAGVLWAFVTPPWRIAAAGYGADVWLMFLALGVGSTLLPFALFYGGLRRLRAEEAGVIATVEPVVAILSAAFFLGENLRPLQLAGAALVLLATLLSTIRAPEPPVLAAERV